MTEFPSQNSGTVDVAEPLVLVVLPRILDLVIKQDRELPAPALFVPHRTSYVIARERLLQIVDRDELELAPEDRIPPVVILIAQARQRRLTAASREEFRIRHWRLVFHSRIHLALERRIESGRLTRAEVHRRIRALGREVFAEIENVLRKEKLLFDHDDLLAIYVEFVAMHGELSFFAPRSLDLWFPSLKEREAEVEAFLDLSLDLAGMFELSRPRGAVLNTVTSEEDERADEDVEIDYDSLDLLVKPDRRRFKFFMKRADRAFDKGNAVVAAILRRMAVRYASNPARAGEALNESRAIIDNLVERLQEALNFDEKAALQWRQALIELFENSRGFWNANKRLLFDLQKVCIDHERETYTVDVSNWFFKTVRDLWAVSSRLCVDLYRSLLGKNREVSKRVIFKRWYHGLSRRPIKRALPNQREVLMSKHLRSAAGRLSSVRLSRAQRERLSILLHAAANSAEQQLRNHLRPRIARSLNEDGLRPSNLPERVARNKLVEELLDCVVHNGRLTMGNMRDAISRSQLKLSDVTFKELWRGDPILRADRRLDRLLDGVYRRGEFYMRWLQRLSSLVFGLPSGRFVMKYLAIPFGGAFVALAGLNHIVVLMGRVFGTGEAQLLSTAEHDYSPLHESVRWTFSQDQPYMQVDLLESGIDAGMVGQSFVLTLPLMLLSVFCLGVFISGLIHVKRFRQAIARAFRSVFIFIKNTFVSFPRWVMSLAWMRWLLRSRAAKFIRRYLLGPLIPAALLCLAAAVFFGFHWYIFLGIFLALDIILNSRAGRELERSMGVWVARAWYRFSAHFLRSLFDMIMGMFRKFLTATERLIYAIDEWLLFKGEESSVAVALKAVLGVAWSVFAYILRFCITLLIEPQINPIKHFPVVTVSHKILLPNQFAFAGFLHDPVGLSKGLAHTTAASTILILPGVFGFLVWELRSNWFLYEANRSPKLRPVPVGDHGETVMRLLKPGLHSGTIPKLYRKMRRASNMAPGPRRRRLQAKLRERLHHQEVAIRHFIERELFALLAESKAWLHGELRVNGVDIRPNSISVTISCPSVDTPCLRLLFREEAEHLFASIPEPGWLTLLADQQKRVFGVALAGLYQISGVEMVDEQLCRYLPLESPLYHINQSGLHVWIGSDRDQEVSYPLRNWGTLRPQPLSLARTVGMPVLSPRQILYTETPVFWRPWVRTWDESIFEPEECPLSPTSRLLPKEIAAL